MTNQDKTLLVASAFAGLAAFALIEMVQSKREIKQLKKRKREMYETMVLLGEHADWMLDSLMEDKAGTREWYAIFHDRVEYLNLVMEMHRV